MSFQILCFKSTLKRRFVECTLFSQYCIRCRSQNSTYYVYSLLHVFLISIIPYFSYFQILIQDLRKGEIKSILGFPKFSYYIKNLFQNSNVPKTCQCSTDNFLSSGFSPYLSKVWSLFTSRVNGASSE